MYFCMFWWAHNNEWNFIWFFSVFFFSFLFFHFFDWKSKKGKENTHETLSEQRAQHIGLLMVIWITFALVIITCARFCCDSSHYSHSNFFGSKCDFCVLFRRERNVKLIHVAVCHVSLIFFIWFYFLSIFFGEIFIQIIW